jgi:hypothetical protein
VYAPVCAIKAVNHPCARVGLDARDGSSVRGVLTRYDEWLPSGEARTTKDWKEALR